MEVKECYKYRNLYFAGKKLIKQETCFIKDLGIKKQRQSTLSLFPNLTKSILYEKTLKLFKFYVTNIQGILVNAFKRKLKNVINTGICIFRKEIAENRKRAPSKN